MEDFSSTEVLLPQPEIIEKPEDTPKSVTGKRRSPTSQVWALATTLVAQAHGLDFNEHFFALQHTPVLKEKSEEPQFFLPEEEAITQQDLIAPIAETANRNRIELLARQYVAGQLSTEEEARLAIVTERVRRLIPHVTEEDFLALEQILEDAERIEMEDRERRRQLGLD
jgi:hypothetical protein